MDILVDIITDKMLVTVGTVESSTWPTANRELSGKRDPAILFLSSGLRCSVLVFVTSSTLLALKTLQSRPLTISVLSDLQPQMPLLFLNNVHQIARCICGQS